MKKHCKTCGGAMCWAAKIAWALVIIGALNWGLVGVFNFDLVAAIFGRIGWLQNLIYILVGLSGLICLFGCRCKTCKGTGKRCMVCTDGTCRECTGTEHVKSMADDAHRQAEDMMEDVKDVVSGDRN